MEILYNAMYFVAPLLRNLSNEQVIVDPFKSNVNGKETLNVFRKSSVLERSTGKLSISDFGSDFFTKSQYWKNSPEKRCDTLESWLCNRLHLKVRLHNAQQLSAVAN